MGFSSGLNIYKSYLCFVVVVTQCFCTQTPRQVYWGGSSWFTAFAF